MDNVSKRNKRIEGDIKRDVSQIIYRNIDNPDLRLISISKVSITKDLSLATIYYTILNNNESQKKKIAKLLSVNNKTIRMFLSKKLRIRAVPLLKFVYDDGLDYAYRIEELLKEAKKDSSSKE